MVIEVCRNASGKDLDENLAIKPVSLQMREMATWLSQHIHRDTDMLYRRNHSSDPPVICHYVAAKQSLSNHGLN